jgi:hypothetical protein
MLGGEHAGSGVRLLGVQGSVGLVGRDKAYFF